MSEENNNKKDASSESEKEEHDMLESINQLKENLKYVETYGLSEEDRKFLANDVGHWPPQIQLMVSAYIKNLRFKNSILYQSLELIASGMIKPEDAGTLAQGALEKVALRDWRHTLDEKSKKN